MLKKKRLMAVSAAIICCAACAGVWAYFTDLSQISVTARTATVGISVDKDRFIVPERMVPGDAHELSYQIRNDNERAMKVKSELVLRSEKPITDEVEWYISDTANGSFELPKPGEEVELEGGQRVKYEALSEDKKEITFSISSGVLDGTEEIINSTEKRTDNVRFFLILAKNANNDFQNAQCELNANIYAIQYKNTDDLDLNKNDDSNWGFVKSIVMSQAQDDA